MDIDKFEKVLLAKPSSISSCTAANNLKMVIQGKLPCGTGKVSVTLRSRCDGDGSKQPMTDMAWKGKGKVVVK